MWPSTEFVTHVTSEKYRTIIVRFVYYALMHKPTMTMNDQFWNTVDATILSEAVFGVANRPDIRVTNTQSLVVYGVLSLYWSKVFISGTSTDYWYQIYSARLDPFSIEMGRVRNVWFLVLSHRIMTYIISSLANGCDCHNFILFFIYTRQIMLDD